MGLAVDSECSAQDQNLGKACATSGEKPLSLHRLSRALSLEVQSGLLHSPLASSFPMARADPARAVPQIRGLLPDLSWIRFFS